MCVCVCVCVCVCNKISLYLLSRIMSPYTLAETCCNKTLQHIKNITVVDSYNPYVHKNLNTSAVLEFAWASNRKVLSLCTP